MYNTTEAVKNALGQSVVRMRLLSESVSLWASDAKPIQSSDGKPIWVFAVGPFPDGKVDGEQLSSLSYSAGCCDGDIGIGNVSSASLSGSIHGVLNLLNVSFTAQVGVDVDGVTQWLNLGTFTVTECTRTDESTTFTAYDAAYTAFGKVYTPTVQSGATASAVLADVANQAGVEVEPTTLNLCTMTVTGDLTGHTCREMVGYIAALCGKNAVITRDGFLRFVWFSSTSQTVTSDDYYAGAMSNGGKSKLHGITCTAGENVLTVGDQTKAVELYNPYMTQASLNTAWSAIGGYEYPVGSVGFYKGLFTEPGDILSLTNLAGVTVSFPAMQITMDIDGGCRCTVSSFGMSDAERETSVTSPGMQAIDRAMEAAEDAMDVAEDALEEAQGAMTSANGKNKVFHRNTAPSASEELTAGDIWFDTANDYRMNTWTGSDWSAFELGGDAIANLSITNAKIGEATIEHGKIASLDMGKATVGKLRALYIDVDNLFAQDITATGTISGATLTGASLSSQSGDSLTTVSNGVVKSYKNSAQALNYAQLDYESLSIKKSVDDATLSTSGLVIRQFSTGKSVSVTPSSITVDGETVATQTWVGNNYSKLLTVASISTGVNPGAAGSDTASVEGSFSVTQTDLPGYTPLCIAGWRCEDTSSSFFNVASLYLSDTNCYYKIRNTSKTAVSGKTENFTVYVLYVKN